VHKTVFLAFVFAAGLAAAAGAQTFVGVLNGANEFPGPGDADGFGVAAFRFEGTTVIYGITIQHLNPTVASHIHRGAAGVEGPVVITLASDYPNDSASGTVTASAALIDEIRRNPSGFYVNVHTGDFPNGAIRSQLSRGITPAYTELAYFPIVGHVDGLNNTRFVADVRVVNGTTAASTATLEFFPSSPAGLSAASVTRSVIVAAGQELVVNDVVSSQFSTTGLGALKVGLADPLAAGVRVFNDLRPAAGGTTGFFLPPKGISDAATSGVLPFLSQASNAEIETNQGFRSNIGWFNPNAIATAATFTAHRASDGAAFGSVNVTINGLSQVQQAVFQLISTVAAADRTQTDFYVTWTSVFPIYVYGAVVDNRTGDVVYVD